MLTTSKFTVRALDESTSAPRKTRKGGGLFFFTSLGGSLTKWCHEGILDREVLILHTFIERDYFKRIRFFSYDYDDKKLLKMLVKEDPRFAAFDLITPPRFWPKGKLVNLLFSLIGPLFHRGQIVKSDLIRTNQLSGSWAGIIGKLITGKPLLLRYGYILSRRLRLNNQRSASTLAKVLERIAHFMTDQVIVTSQIAREYALGLCRSEAHVSLVPTYVDTSLFHQKTTYDFNKPLLYAGRFTRQKNLENLIKACAQIGWPLDLIGSGEDLKHLAHIAEISGAKVRFLGHHDNADLARIMRSYSVFVLPSLHEGLPKALIEAMASGLICVGTDVPGISDIITDQKNGYLSPNITSEALADTLSKVRREQNISLAKAARQTIVTTYNIDRYTDLEGEIIRSITATLCKN